MNEPDDAFIKRSQHLPQLAKQLSLQHRGRGGWRQGAGRPKCKTAGVSHLKRVEVKASYPMHLTVRLRTGVPTLRSKKAFQVFQRAIAGAKQKGLRVLQFAVLGNHFHILAEADSNAVLTRSMRSLNISVAKGLNRIARAGKGPTTGAVLKDRYDLKRLTTPTQVRNALVYILANASKHYKHAQVFDWYSSFPVFEGVEKLARLRLDLDWRKLRIEDKQRKVIEKMLSPAVSWLARAGWLRAGS